MLLTRKIKSADVSAATAVRKTANIGDDLYMGNDDNANQKALNRLHMSKSDHNALSPNIGSGMGGAVGGVGGTRQTLSYMTPVIAAGPDGQSVPMLMLTIRSQASEIDDDDGGGVPSQQGQGGVGGGKSDRLAKGIPPGPTKTDTLQSLQSLESDIGLGSRDNSGFPLMKPKSISQNEDTLNTLTSGGAAGIAGSSQTNIFDKQMSTDSYASTLLSGKSPAEFKGILLLFLFFAFFLELKLKVSCM